VTQQQQDGYAGQVVRNVQLQQHLQQNNMLHNVLHKMSGTCVTNVCCPSSSRMGMLGR
jgi:hypothetical protein